MKFFFGRKSETGAKKKQIRFPRGNNNYLP